MQAALSGIVLASQLSEEMDMKNQRGMTLIGWVIVLAIIAFFCYASDAFSTYVSRILWRPKNHE
jgi:Mn2+/Fe2+ NRAMP family transporter